MLSEYNFLVEPIVLKDESIKISIMQGFIDDLYIVLSIHARTTTIALALTGSLCASLILIIIGVSSLIQNPPEVHKVKPRSQRLKNRILYPEDCFTVRRLRPIYPRQSYGRNIAEGTVTQYQSGKTDAISLSNCGLKSIKRSPTDLNLSHLQLTACPARLGFLGPQLTSLNLSSNKLTELPPEVGCLVGLKYLYLRGNQLTTLPHSLCHLNNLQALDVQHNLFDEFPSCLPHMEGLQCLRIDSNSLTSIPAVIKSLYNLREFSIAFNQISHIPEEISQLRNLQVLLLSHNMLTHVPSNLGSLKHLVKLDVSYNKIFTLPSSIVWCSRLNTLLANHNRLVKLPEKIGHLFTLKEINIQCNRLSYLPASVMLMDLKVFKVTGNPLLTSAPKANEQTCCQAWQPLKLIELSAHVIHNQQLRWQPGSLPTELSDLLRSVKFCIHCDRPLFISFIQSSAFSSCLNGTQLPFYQFICPYPNSCSFKTEYFSLDVK
ncbi:hypothetical protein CAPTEDRAFT_191186 [Capitella teleta]|uniref:Disease resistance R13L4/SHOC-2-like LRR domain-containing protein n=1 Tax=Capitella teleta TaxID=283909 RepID=R7U980_CAPTE|nr:hypothetical protein CAPTEDRAFT_191186 [Capitella teleta]|eukprot:ELU02905.1 hypothetical protein CAPTEDRAFT_191186 [Capitella teleta]